MAQTFVTGGTGFLSQWIIDGLLNQGHKVRTTARSETKAEPLRKHWAKQAESGLLEIVIIPDLSAPGCLDAHLQGVEYLFAVASVFNFEGVTDFKTQLVDVSINMATSTYESAVKNGVKKAIYTGSVACCLDYGKGPFYDHVYTEADWNPDSYEKACSVSDVFRSYSASKALAEQAVWKLHKGNEQKIAVTYLHMPLIFGPSCVPGSSYNVSNDLVKQLAEGVELPDMFPAFIDGRTLAQGEIACMDAPVTDNKRYLIADGESLWNQVVPTINEADGKALKVPQKPATYWKIDASRLEKDTGFKSMYSLDKTITDICEELKTRA